MPILSRPSNYILCWQQQYFHFVRFNAFFSYLHLPVFVFAIISRGPTSRPECVRVCGCGCMSKRCRWKNRYRLNPCLQHLSVFCSCYLDGWWCFFLDGEGILYLCISYILSSLKAQVFSIPNPPIYPGRCKTRRWHPDRGRDRRGPFNH